MATTITNNDPSIASERTYRDLDLNFTAHPVTKDVVRRYDEESVKASLKNLILTRNYERPFHSEIGSPVRALLFDLVTPLTALTVKRAIIDVINNFEPRVSLNSVVAIEDLSNYGFNVTLKYTILNRDLPVISTLFLERIR